MNGNGILSNLFNYIKKNFKIDLSSSMDDHEYFLSGQEWIESKG